MVLHLYSRSASTSEVSLTVHFSFFSLWRAVINPLFLHLQLCSCDLACGGQEASERAASVGHTVAFLHGCDKLSDRINVSKKRLPSAPSLRV